MKDVLQVFKSASVPIDNDVLNALIETYAVLFSIQIRIQAMR